MRYTKFFLNHFSRFQIEHTEMVSPCVWVKGVVHYGMGDFVTHKGEGDTLEEACKDLLFSKYGDQLEELIDNENLKSETLKSPSKSPRNQHNHITRDIKRKGECPACDHSMAKSSARTVLENFLYEQNVPREECEDGAKRLLKNLKEIGLTVTWIKD